MPRKRRRLGTLLVLPAFLSSGGLLLAPLPLRGDGFPLLLLLLLLLPLSPGLSFALSCDWRRCCLPEPAPPLALTLSEFVGVFGLLTSFGDVGDAIGDLPVFSPGGSDEGGAALPLLGEVADCCP